MIKTSHFDLYTKAGEELMSEDLNPWQSYPRPQLKRDKYMILNPYSSSKNENGFKEVQKDFFTTALEKGQPKAKQLVLSKYQQMR